MFKIGDFSKLSAVSVRMLRHYDKLKLLIPEHVDDLSGYRYYSAAQLRTINKIQKLKEMGFSLGIIKEMLESAADAERLRAYFTLREIEVTEELHLLQKQSRLLESSLELLREDVISMNYHVSVKEIPAHQVASVRKVIPAYTEEGKLWGLLGAEIAAQQIKVADPAYVTAIFHDPEYKETAVDIEVQTAVTGNYSNTDDVLFKGFDKVTVASVMVNGNYDQMQSVKEAAAQWVEDNRYELSGPMFIIYHVSPAKDPNPENWVTEACYPITRRA
ncbi:MerR family transcriptional regulator [Paenibacillus albidus]|uniref:MerR family transcriptional regulator n=1 Tax=Paenibacillus albidus TaxID=2041023 RepID=A0A917CCS9_9BACL|nr:MerR family transcriptional regulator [Paenibacillus albidus]GGF79361.1 MerR family transcriptional regulator [Paenibacillus albidus]